MVGTVKAVARKQARALLQRWSHLTLLSHGGEACFNVCLVAGVWKLCSSFVKGRDETVSAVLGLAVDVH